MQRSLIISADRFKSVTSELLNLLISSTTRHIRYKFEILSTYSSIEVGNYEIEIKSSYEYIETQSLFND